MYTTNVILREVQNKSIHMALYCYIQGAICRGGDAGVLPFPVYISPPLLNDFFPLLYQIYPPSK